MEALLGVGRVWLLHRALIPNADKPQWFRQTADSRASHACACAKPAHYSPKAKMLINNRQLQTGLGLHLMRTQDFMAAMSPLLSRDC